MPLRRTLRPQRLIKRGRFFHARARDCARCRLRQVCRRRGGPITRSPSAMTTRPCPGPPSARAMARRRPAPPPPPSLGGWREIAGSPSRLCIRWPGFEPPAPLPPLVSLVDSQLQTAARAATDLRRLFSGDPALCHVTCEFIRTLGVAEKTRLQDLALSGCSSATLEKCVA